MLRLHLALALLVAAGASACADEATSSAAPTLDPGAPTAPAETTTSTSSSATSTTTAPDRTSTTTTTAGVARCSRVTDFDEPNWVVVNDGVMGGQSIGAGLLDGGVLTFEGAIVTDGGGFSSRQ